MSLRSAEGLGGAAVVRKWRAIVEDHLEKVCTHCHDTYPRKYDCEKCDGMGYVETDLGKALLAFLRRRNFVIAKSD